MYKNKKSAIITGLLIFGLAIFIMIAFSGRWRIVPLMAIVPFGWFSLQWCISTSSKKILEMAIADAVSRDIRPVNRHVPIITGMTMLVLAGSLFYGLSNWWVYILNAPILLYGFFSLKFGIFASNQALKEMTNFGFLTKKTEDEFDNIL